LNGVFVTGTDTGIGKTRASTTLLRAHRALGRRAIGMKPIASGCRASADGFRNEDAEALVAASDPPPPYALCNPFALPLAIAPHLAAHEAGVEIGLAPIELAFRELCAMSDRVVVEGVGGWAVPLSEKLMQADLVRALDVTVILVVGLRLGCLNHAVLTVQSVIGHGLRCLGLVLNRAPAGFIGDAATLTNADILRKILDIPVLGGLGENLTELPTDWRVMLNHLERVGSIQDC